MRPKSDYNGSKSTTDLNGANMSKTVSIIIPILNEADNLPSLLPHLTQLTPAPQQVILVDGGSTDDSVGVIKKWLDKYQGQIQWQLTASMAGRAVQMNTGAEQATGDILLFLHADSQLPTTAIADVKVALKKYKWGRFNVCLNSHQPMLKVVGYMINGRSRLTGIATGDQAIFMTKALFEQIGGYPDQPLMEDIELCKRLKNIAKPACLKEKVVTSSRRWQQYGTWRTIFLMWHLRFDYWRGVSADDIKRRYYKNHNE